MAALEPALRTAQARGLLVNVQVIGDPGLPSADVARAVLAAVDSVLGALPPHQAMLTVLAAGQEAELYLTFSELPPASAGITSASLARFGRDLPTAAGWRAAVTPWEAGPGCVEISWRVSGWAG